MNEPSAAPAERPDKPEKDRGKGEMLTELQITEIREVFSLFDKDGDGYVSNVHLGTIIRALHQNPSEEEVYKLQKEIDPSHSGRFDQNSLISLVAKRAKDQDNLETLLKHLRVFDTDDDGRLSTQEFVFAMTNLGEQMEEPEVQEILRDTDAVYEEHIYIEEFAKLLMQR